MVIGMRTHCLDGCEPTASPWARWLRLASITTTREAVMRHPYAEQWVDDIRSVCAPGRCDRGCLGCGDRYTEVCMATVGVEVEYHRSSPAPELDGWEVGDPLMVDCPLAHPWVFPMVGRARRSTNRAGPGTTR